MIMDEEPPPGSPPDQLKRFQDGPWFQTQLALCAIIGLSSFLTFALLRTRLKVLYAPRTLLKGESIAVFLISGIFIGVRQDSHLMKFMTKTVFWVGSFRR